ncbi:MAG TPA: LysR family transcriptional regulator [Terriglobia bacterium]|nr:LysR family transcriptional regulator [Terriglobia bacterium]
MTFDALYLYRDVIAARSFSAGAASRGVSQSAASQTVRQLEHELGVKLIDRTQRPFTVTPEGQKFFEASVALIDQLEKAKAEISRQRESVEGTARVAVIYSVGLQAMGYYTQRFNARYPHAKVRMAFLHPREVVEAVVNDTADLGILSFPPQLRSLEVIEWREEPMVFVCRPDHPLARKKVVAAREMAEERFIAFDKNLPVRKAIDKALRRRGVRVQVAMEFDNIETIKQAIVTQPGVSILPEPSVSQEIEYKSLAAVPTEMKDLARPIGIIHRRGKLLTPAAAKLLEFLASERQR